MKLSKLILEQAITSIKWTKKWGGNITKSGKKIFKYVSQDERFEISQHGVTHQYYHPITHMSQTTTKIVWIIFDHKNGKQVGREAGYKLLSDAQKSLEQQIEAGWIT